MRIRTTIQSRTGNAMVLSTLILLALTSVGILSVQHTNTDLMAAGNLSQASKASVAAEVGMGQSRGLLGDQAVCYTWTVNKAKTEQFKGNAAYSASDCSGQTVQASTSKSLLMVERSSVAVGNLHLSSVRGADAIARLQQDMAYDGEIFHISELPGLPGYQVEGAGGGGSSMCFQVWDVKARGGIPTMGELVPETLCPKTTGRPCFDDGDCDAGSTCVAAHCFCQPRKVVVNGLARVVAGPTPCYLN